MSGPAGADRARDSALAAVALAVGAVMFGLAAAGYFFVDDFLQFSLARRVHGLHYLLLPNFGHLQPGFWALEKALIHVAPMNYQVALGIAAALLALSVAYLYRILRLLFEPSWAQVLLAGAFGLSTLWLHTVMWWPAAVQFVPVTLLGLVSIDGFLRYVLGGPKRWVVISAAAFAGALLFYEKGALILPYLWMFGVLVLGRGRRLRDGVAGVLRAWRAWTPHLAVLAVYAAVFIGGHYGSVGSRPSPAGLAGFVWVSWADALAPGVLGGSLGWSWIGPLGIAAPPLAQVVGAQLVFGAAVAVSILRDRTSWRPWAVFAIAFLLSVVPVGLARLTLFGIGIALDQRYVADLPGVLALCVAFAFFTPRGAEPRHRRPLLPRPLAVVLPAAACAGYLAVFAVSAAPLTHQWSLFSAYPYAADVRDSVGALVRQGGSYALYDMTVPGGILTPAWYPYTRDSYFVQLFALPARFNVAEPRMYVLDSAGRAVPAVWRPLASASSVATCSSEAAIQLSTTVPAGPDLVALTYRAAGPATVHLAVDEGDGTWTAATGEFTTFPVPAGGGKLIADLRPIPVARVRVSVDPGQTLCVESLQIGRAVPATGG